MADRNKIPGGGGGRNPAKQMARVGGKMAGNGGKMAGNGGGKKVAPPGQIPIGRELVESTDSMSSSDACIVGVEEISSSPMEFAFHAPNIKSSSNTSSSKEATASPEVVRRGQVVTGSSRAAATLGHAGGRGGGVPTHRHTEECEEADPDEAGSYSDFEHGSDVSSLDSSSDSDSRRGSEDDGVDGLVLLNSTRLRPAAVRSSSMDINFIKLYLHTYRSLFTRKDITAAVLPLAFYGNLSNSPFRSLCWRVLLNVLPNSSSEWQAAIDNSRRSYQIIKEKYLNPVLPDIQNLDIKRNNPLSQDDDSPWNQRFQDEKLQTSIQIDLERTYPEIDFFQNRDVRKILANILFLYAKTHPDILYIQGMHELLAPLLYVLNCDITTYNKVMTFSTGVDQTCLAELKETVPADIFQNDSLEPDTYCLFDVLMELMGGYFKPSKPGSFQTTKKLDQEEPFREPKDYIEGNKTVEKLAYIQEVLLKQHDLDLYKKLTNLKVVMATFGLKWVRLLFSQTFKFPDFLIIWDAIFADSCPPDLLEQVFLALLLSLKDLLMKYDYSEANCLLHRVPDNLDISYLVGFALHLKDPIRFPKPGGSVFDNGTRARRRPPNSIELPSWDLGSGHLAGGVAPPPGRSFPPPPPSRSGGQHHGGGGGGGGGVRAKTAPGGKKLSRRERAKAGQRERLEGEKELYTFVKTYKIKDLNDYIEVDLKDVKEEQYDDCDVRELQEHGQAHAHDDGEASPRSCSNEQCCSEQYLRKVEILRHLDQIKNLLQKETLVNRVQIFKTLTDLQRTVDDIVKPEESNPSPTGGREKGRCHGGGGGGAAVGGGGGAASGGGAPGPKGKHQPQQRASPSPTKNEKSPRKMGLLFGFLNN